MKKQLGGQICGRLHPTIKKAAKMPRNPVAISSGVFCALTETKSMSENHKYIKARIKTQEHIELVYSDAKYWGNPPKDRIWFPLADEVILPYLGESVWLRKKRSGLLNFYYEIKDTDGLIVMPNWIEYFESDYLVPPAEWKNGYDESITIDTWLDAYKTRSIIIDDIIIITG
jgi:hypothetical protein